MRFLRKCSRSSFREEEIKIFFDNRREGRKFKVNVVFGVYEESSGK